MDSLKHILCVALGGSIGSLGRFFTSGLVSRYFAMPMFPIGTLVVNVMGCFLIGLIAGLAEKTGLLSYELKLLLITGFLGGFTTFSAFGFETMFLIRREEIFMACLNLILSVILGLLSVWMGTKLIATLVS